MSAGKAKRMLIHTKQGDQWTTREFLSIADAKRYLRANGTKFKDEYAFYTQDFGTIVNDDKLIEIEEAFEDEEKFEFFGKIYIPLSSWCLKNGIDYKTGISLSASKKINTVKIGRKGRIFVEESPINLPYKDRAINVDGVSYIPLSLWAERNGVDYNKAHYLCRKDLLKHIEIPRNKLRKIYVDERVNYGKE